jgi:hypothetical protein
MTTLDKTPASELQEFVTIPKDEYHKIALKLKAIESTFNLLRVRLLELQKVNEFSLMTSAEAQAFESILHPNFEDLYSIILQLNKSDDYRLRDTGNHLMTYKNHAGFLLGFFDPLIEKNGDPVHGIDIRGISKDELESFLLLINEVCNGLPLCIKNFEETFIAKTASNGNRLVSSPVPENQLTKKIEGLKELQKARYWASEIDCMLQFIDCVDLVDLNGCDMSISREQMDGLFFLL